MIKKEYMKPNVKAMGILEESELLVYSVKSSGLGEGEELSQDKDNPTGNTWDDAMSRRKNVWDDDEEY